MRHELRTANCEIQLIFGYTDAVGSRERNVLFRLPTDFRWISSDRVLAYTDAAAATNRNGLLNCMTAIAM